MELLPALTDGIREQAGVRVVVESPTVEIRPIPPPALFGNTYSRRCGDCTHYAVDVLGPPNNGHYCQRDGELLWVRWA